MGASIFNAEYRDLQNTWRSRAANNRYVLCMEGGYQPNRSWLFSGKWFLAGGRPYTPIDVEASAAVNSEVLNASKINAGRIPAYHSLSAGVDRQFYFRDTNLTLYFDVWNACNRPNISEYYWNEMARKRGSRKQWEIMPIAGAVCLPPRRQRSQEHPSC